MKQQSTSQQPDLDWSQVQETVKMLTATMCQVENAMREGSNAVETLTSGFMSMATNAESITQAVEKLGDSEEKEAILNFSRENSSHIQASIIAFQFYDKLYQRLQQTTQNLSELSQLVESPDRLYNPAEWSQLQNNILARSTTQNDKQLLEAIMSGKSIEEALALSSQQTEETDDDDIELF
ncbi:MAG: hypothetical protein DRQ61_09315 [Gammaproteobacteria bacterium]|nr:MAG: hypothetical protein DRQ61_09315 [Gammaproteobacteria bacterium]